ncbi:MAG: zinc ribbon domain-containing protein [Clostridia bacterium]|nr:zinc ribbon domain-containing protein [Clostridia bacterium]
MKACKFCETRMPDDAQHCPSCGSNVFLHVCENCSQLFDSGFCPNCGVKAGQKKKICPECHSAYFSNACPNCGYTPSRKPVVQEVVHKHVYVEPEQRPQPTPTQARQVKKKGKGCGCLIWILIFLIVAGLIGNLTSSKRSSTSSTRTTTSTKKTTTVTKDPNVTTAPTATPEPAIISAQEKVNKYFENADADEIAAVQKSESSLYRYEAQQSGNVLNVRRSWADDRGMVGTSKYEPDYIGALGFVAVYDNQNMEKNANFGTTPWKVPVYQKDKQFWQETGSIDHKTEVVVIGQELELPKRSYSTSRCSGYLQVIRMDTGEACWLNVENFVTSAYWEKSLTGAMEKGYCIASFKQVSDYYPVTKGKEKTELEDGTLVLLPMKSKNYASSPDKTNNPIVGIVFKEWKYGFGGVNVFFNEADLTLVY